ncbi:hypothetical protein EDI_158380 [Entamoeba dispar SAW760]|uniref:UBR-type domain-containing protein n=1 Tax=Entamoeba dispar (strain ATCC PRA-260 / SAW760) TaxID=370354 RepID=B0E9R3_ENTDS|nr:uncharacterized protein EDI_158380 [Entamoeba dispar SAW760]EDR28710.1 hypothetical protein EDI_158380 [Entamoeba dispar SAW760]|eukprot:EDR28710.1 hypothetical protein EDI_158380 [Entamoeba dispar SAW760]
MSKGIDINKEIKLKSEQWKIPGRAPPSVITERGMTLKECESAHNFISETIKKLSNLDKLIFYDQYTDDLTPELLYKYQTTDKCYTLIPPKEISYQCLDCSDGDLHSFILCSECAEEHKRAGHLLLQHMSNDTEICHCGDIFLEKSKIKICHIHQYNSIQVSASEESRTTEEINAIKKNVEEIFNRIEIMSQLVIPEMVIQMCDKILDVLSKRYEPDIRVFVLHIVRWLNRVIRINPIRKVIKEVFKTKIKTNGRFLLTNSIEEYQENNCLYVKRRNQTELANTEVTAHEIFLNLCIMNQPTSSYVARLLYLILDKENKNDFLPEYRRAYATVAFHGTYLPKHLGILLDTIDIKTIIPHILNLLIVVIKEKKPLKDRNAMSQFVSWLLADEDNILGIIQNENNLTTFIELCDQLTFYPTPLDKTTSSVMKLFHPIFIAVMTRIQIVSFKDSLQRDNEEESNSENELIKMHRRVSLLIGKYLKEHAQNIVKTLNKIVFGRDQGKTQMNRSVIPSHYYLFSLIGWIANQLMTQPIPNELTNDVFQFLEIGTNEDIKIYLQFSYLIYTISHDKIYFTSILELKNNKAPQCEVQDYFGELTYPILYSSLIFVSHACLLSLGAHRFVDFLREIAYVQEDNLTNQDLCVNAVILDFINIICTFSRFGQTPEVNETSFLNYYLYNIKLCTPANSVNSQVKEYIGNALLMAEQTNNTQKIITKNTVPIMKSSIKITRPASKSSNDRLTLKKYKGEWSKKSIDSRLSMSIMKTTFEKSFKKSVSTKEESTFSKHDITQDLLTNADISIYQFRKRCDNEPLGIDQSTEIKKEEITKEEYQKMLIKLRMEQKSMTEIKIDQTSFEWPELAIDPTKRTNQPDFFFPFVNASCSISFKINIINKFLLEPISQGRREAFLSFLNPRFTIGNFCVNLQSRINDLLSDKNLNNGLLSKTKMVNTTNYIFILRFLWILIVHRRARGITTNDIFLNPHFVKLLCTCYGYFFADIFMLIPENSVEGLLRDITELFSKEPFIIPVAMSRTEKLVHPIKYFINAILKNPISAFFFIDEKSQKKIAEVNPLNTGITSLFNEIASQALTSKKKK